MNELPKIFCAIDTSDLDQAKELIKKTTSAGCGIKLGLEFFNSLGPQGVKNVMEACNDPSIFLDLKYYDIPNTVAGAVRSASKLGISYLNVHASGGLDMMKAAKDACDPKTKLLAVTILTSFDNHSLQEAGYQKTMTDCVRQLAQLSQKASLDGVVCSAHEIEVLRQECDDDFVLMVPGIRPKESDQNDQKRIMDPKEALDKGATHLVIGRPITKAHDPVSAARNIIGSL